MESKADVRGDAISDGVLTENSRYLQDLKSSCLLLLDRLNSNTSCDETQAQRDLAPNPSPGPIPSKPMPIEEFLGPVFELTGIRASRSISLQLYVSSAGRSTNIKVATFQTFLQLLTGSVGTYQIVLEDPEIEGLDVQPFRISYMTVGFDYDPKIGFHNMDVHTDIEEIYPETKSPEKMRERARKLVDRVRKILEFIALLKTLGVLAGLSGFAGVP